MRVRGPGGRRSSQVAAFARPVQSMGAWDLRDGLAVACPDEDDLAPLKDVPDSVLERFRGVANVRNTYRCLRTLAPSQRSTSLELCHQPRVEPELHREHEQSRTQHVRFSALNLVQGMPLSASQSLAHFPFLHWLHVIV